MTVLRELEGAFAGAATIISLAIGVAVLTSLVFWIVRDPILSFAILLGSMCFVSYVGWLILYLRRKAKEKRDAR